MNFTHRKILFSIYFKQFIHFPGNKYLLEKEKQKMTHFFAVPSARPRIWPGPAPRTRGCASQAATWAWASKATLPRTPAWAGRRSDQRWPFIQIRRPRVRFARNKNRRHGAPGENPNSLSVALSLSSPRSALFSAQAAVGDMAPLAAPSPARALPMWVSALPSSGLATVPFSPR